MRTYIAAFLEDCRARNLSRTTLQSYQTNLQQFCTFMESQDQKICRDSVQAYVSHIQEHFRPTSVNQKIATINLFFTYLTEMHVLQENPLKKLNIHQTQVELPPRTVEAENIASVLRFAYQEKELSKPGTPAHMATIRDIAVLELLFYSGMRVSELSALSLKDVNFQTKTVFIAGAGQRCRIVQIDSKEALRALDEYKREFWPEMVVAGSFFVNRLGNPLSVQSVRDMVKRYAKLANVTQPLTPRILRDSVATMLAEEGANLVSLQHLLGHSSVSRTKRYVTGIEEGIAALHPRNRMHLEG